MIEFIKLVTSLFFHALIIISVYERGKRLVRSIKDYRQTKDASVLKTEVLLFSVTLILAAVLYYFTIYKVR